MVSWVPYSPPSCSTRGKPFPCGAFTTGLPDGHYVGAAKSWKTGKIMVGTIKQERLVIMYYLDINKNIFRSGLVCKINNGSLVEEHLEFRILVAGRELDWRDGSDDDNTNLVHIPGNDTKHIIGLLENTIGSVINGNMFAVVEDKQSNSAQFTVPQCSEKVTTPIEYTDGFKVLVQVHPSTLKSLCRKVIRKLIFNKRKHFNMLNNVPTFQKLLNKNDMTKYIAYKA